MSPTTHLPCWTHGESAFCFLTDTKARPMNTRDKEIEQSKARSHSASFVHRKRKLRDQRAGKSQLLHATVPSPIGCNSSRTLNDNSPSNKWNLREKYLVPVHQSDSMTYPQTSFSSPKTLHACERPRLVLNVTSINTLNKGCPSCSVEGACCDCHRPYAAKSEIKPLLEDILGDEVLSPRPGFGCFRHEQFADIPYASTSDYVRDILDFQFQIIMPAHDLSTELFDITNVYSVFAHLPRFPLFYYAGLALVGMLHERLRAGPKFQNSLKLLYARGQAMTIIRRYLNHAGWQKRNQHQGLVSAIVLLACLEYASGQRENGDQHLKALDEITNQLQDSAGFAILNSCSEQMLVTSYKATFAMAGWLDSTDYTEDWQPSYPLFPPVIQLRRLLNKLPFGFYNLVIESKICTRTIQILGRAVEIEIERQDGAAQRVRASRSRQVRSHVTMFEACPILQGSDDTQAVLVDKMICFALTLFCTSSSHTIMSQTVNFFTHCKAQLSSRLRTFQPQSDSERKLLVWLFIVAVNSCRPISYTGSILTDGGMALLRLFFTRFPELVRGKDWEDIESTLLQFFCTPQLSRFWSKSWDHLVFLMEETQHIL